MYLITGNLSHNKASKKAVRSTLINKRILTISDSQPYFLINQIQNVFEGGKKRSTSNQQVRHIVHLRKQHHLLLHNFRFAFRSVYYDFGVLQCKSTATLQGPFCVNVFRCIIKLRESKISLVCYTEQGSSVCSDRFWAPSGRQVLGFATDCIIFQSNLEKSLNYFNRELILHAFNLHFGLS